MTNRLQKIEKAIKNMSDDKFNELLNELGVKEEQWAPQIRETYWSVLDSGDVDYSGWLGDDIDYYRLLMNNVFKTEDEAGIQRYFNIEKAKLIREIEDSSDIMDWEGEDQLKYHLYYNYYDKKVYISSNWTFEAQGTTYTTNREFLENLIKNEPERVKKYLFRIGE